jgi:hypothetical protein
MKKIMVVGLVLLAAGFAFADDYGDAKAKVILTINPNIAVSSVGMVGEIQSLQTGSATIPVIFRVDANMQTIVIRAGATPLFKGNDPNPGEAEGGVGAAEADPIPLAGPGMIVNPEDANEMASGGSDNLLEWGAEVSEFSTLEGDWTAALTVPGDYESSQPGHFSQDVLVETTWSNGVDEQQPGEYSGYVLLQCWIPAPVSDPG